MGQIVSHIKSVLVTAVGSDQTTQTPHEDQQQKQRSHHTVTIPRANITKPFSSSNPKPVTDFTTPPQAPYIVKWIGPYNNKQKILLVGEGDFSFSVSLALAFGSASNIIATSLDPLGFLIRNYGMFLTNKMYLKTKGGTVIHEINARTMVKDPLLGKLKFDRVIFNFPHAGTFGKTDSDLRQHKTLVREFIRNAKKMINEDGEIHIRHKSNGFFMEWDIPGIGYDQGLSLIQEVEFNPTKYTGYHTKYGFGGDKDFDCIPCKTYKFGPSPN